MKKIIICFVVLSVSIINRTNAMRIWFGTWPGCHFPGRSCIIIGKYEGALSAEATYSPSTGLSMTFSETDIPKEYKKDFLTPRFTEEYEIPLSDDLCTAMKMPRGSKILKGNYEIRSTGKTYTVNFGKPGSIFPGKPTDPKASSIGEPIIITGKK